MKAFLTATEVAKLLNIHRSTVTRWIEKGIIKRCIKIEGTQNWRIPLAAYEEIHELIKKI